MIKLFLLLTKTVFSLFQILLIGLSVISCNKQELQNTGNKVNSKDSNKLTGVSNNEQRLIFSYSGFLDSLSNNTLYWKDGTTMQYDDGIKNKTHDQMLENADIEDMFFQQYVKGEKWEAPPGENFDPGRIRNEPFFRKIYGENTSEVEKNLTDVEWTDGSILKFNKINGAADSLRKVISELKQLPGGFQKYLNDPAGTFVWRNIAGTERLSNHSFATAIDINTKYSDYWQWDNKKIYKNRIPFEIVKIFEKYGFIWGGKWYHYDTMHFEFRPELISN